MVKATAVIAGLSGMSASIATLLPESDALEAIGRWPLVVILGAVCCFSTWLMYRQARENTQAILKMSEDNRASVSELAKSMRDSMEMHNKEHAAATEKMSAALMSQAVELAKKPCMK